MKKNRHYFAIGLFVILGFVLLAAGCVLFGGSSLFARKVTLETYIDDTVQGLDVGSPVKFRGLRIGKVEKIGFTGTAYADAAHIPEDDLDAHKPLTYIRIIFSIDERKHPTFSEEHLREMIKRGLRASLELQGITGSIYVNLDFQHDKASDSALSFPWEPEYIYIPSTPTDLQDLLNVVENIAHEIGEIDFQEMSDAVTLLTKNIDKTLADVKLPELSNTARQLMTSLTQQSERLGSLLAQIDTESLNLDLQRLSQNLASSAETLKAELPKLTASADATLEQTQTMLSNASALIQELQGTVAELKASVDPQAIGLELNDTLSTLSRTGASVEALVNELRERPSRLIFDSQLED